jgi:dihydrofolate reductase
VSQPLLTLIAARGANGCIGVAGALPWRLASDLKHFKAVTLGKPVLMGRKTWDSIGKPLPGRANLVLTRDLGFRAEGGFVYTELTAMLAAGRAMAIAGGAEDVCIIGGATLYQATLPLCDRLILTEVDLSPVGDAFFPHFEAKLFQETSRVVIEAGPKDEAAMVIRVLDRA